MSSKDRGIDVQAHLKELAKKKGSKQIMIKNVPPGTPPPPGIGTSRTQIKETSKEVIMPDGSRKMEDPEVWRRKRLQELRRGGVTSETARRAIDKKDEALKATVPEIRMVGSIPVKVIRRKPKKRDRRMDRRRDLTGGLAARKKLYEKMGFIPQETGKPFPGKQPKLKEVGKDEKSTK